MDLCEDREEGVPPSKTTQRNQPGLELGPEPELEPETSCVCLQCNCMKFFICRFTKRRQLSKKSVHQGLSTEPSFVSLKSDWCERCSSGFERQELSSAERNMIKEKQREPSAKTASAEEELARVRTTFVWRVSPEILIQLLDALVTESVFNDLEKESILEGNPVRADKARCFIDTVRKKGDKACKIMIRHLQTIDPSLFFQLHLYSDPSALQDSLQNCQPKLKSNLKKKFQCVFEGIAKAGNPTLLNQIYTELYITEGGTAE
ncbi:uncharacterized protein LOC102308929, partial [Haplochromis burtoni]|uniref:uncharacterized protein LOC102308929 n=1 Tax=Haplochromis burtoni TaxID=8153 RepID=UPI001C2D86DF